jgi:hypothetical protein
LECDPIPYWFAFAFLIGMRFISLLEFICFPYWNALVKKYPLMRFFQVEMYAFWVFFQVEMYAL